MVKRVCIFIAALLFALSQTQPVLAGGTKQSTSNQLQMSVDELKKRLNITTEQESEFSPVIESHTRERDALFEKYGLTKEGASISLRDLRSFRKEMLLLSSKTKEKLSGILTETQMKEWDAIQEENHSEIRSHFSLG